MYCPSCGVAVAQGLPYCNYCGEKLSGSRGEKEIESSDLKPGNLVFAIMAVFIFGLIAIAILMGMMKSVLRLEAGQILGISSLIFLIMLLIEGVFIRLLFRSKRGNEEAADRVLSKAQATKELDAAGERFLAEPLSSVTENTTRTFEPALKNMKDKG